MSRSTNLTRLTVGLFVLSGVGMVSAFDSNTQTISVRAEVPLNCRVSLQGGTGQFNGAGVTQLGSTNEFCNAAGGYQILARAQGTVDGASISIDGKSFPLISGAEFLIVNSQGPASTSRAISYDMGTSDGGGSLTLRIEAK